MGKNKVIKSFTSDGTLAIPAGVKSVVVSASRIFNSVAVVREDQYGNALVNCADGQLVGWGANTRGQLGEGSVSSHTVPTQVSGGLSFRYLFAGQGSTFGISAGGTLWAWGYNPAGQLGTGDVTSYSSPNAVVGALSIRKVQMGGFDGNSTTIATRMDGALYAWGSNGNGQIGDGTVTVKSSPTLVLGTHTFSDEFITSGLSSYGIDTAGALWAWGFNGNGELGDGTVVPKSSPVAVLGSHSFSKVYAMNYRGQANSVLYAMALDTAGHLWAWGGNTSGQLGVGDVASRSSPIAVLGSHSFSKVVVGQEFVLALDTAGAAWAWGLNTNGQLGVGDVVPRSSPVAVLGGLSFSDIFTDGLRSCWALQSSGQLYAWGFNQAGQLGLGDVTPRSSPVISSVGLNFTNIYPSLNGYFIGEGNGGDGTLYGCGANSANGYLGNNSTSAVSFPVLVFGGRKSLKYLAPQVTRIAVSPGTTYSVGLSKYYATFGSTYVGQLINQIDVEFEQ